MPKPTKMYYSITEVAKITDLKAHILRYWETEFSILHPKKNRAGNRAYRTKDIEVVKLIKRLLYTEGYTIEGAKRHIQKMRSEGYKPGKAVVTGAPKKKDVPSKREKDTSAKLLEIRKELKEVLVLLDAAPK